MDSASSPQHEEHRGAKDRVPSSSHHPRRGQRHNTEESDRGEGEAGAALVCGMCWGVGHICPFCTSFSTKRSTKRYFTCPTCPSFGTTEFKKDVFPLCTADWRVSLRRSEVRRIKRSYFSTRVCRPEDSDPLIFGGSVEM